MDMLAPREPTPNLGMLPFDLEEMALVPCLVPLGSLRGPLERAFGWMLGTSETRHAVNVLDEPCPERVEAWRRLDQRVWSIGALGIDDHTPPQEARTTDDRWDLVGKPCPRHACNHTDAGIGQ